MKNKKGFWQGALIGALAVLLVLGLVSCGINVGGNAVSKKTETKIWLIEKLIQKCYAGEVDEEVLEEGIIKGYVSGLEDPYSTYYTKEETKNLFESVQGEFIGVGAVLTQDPDTGVVTILQVYDESPAMKAGVKDEDILYKVDDKEVTGVDLNEVVRWIKGEENTEVKLTVIRDDKELDMTAVRAEIEVISVEYKMLESGIGYIAVSEFQDTTYDQYKTALEELEKQGMKSLIVDLRNNPGGSLDTVCKMADLMLPEGLIVYTEDKAGNREEHKSDEKNQFTKPLVVMINGNSASASEIFSGAIQDHETGTILGTQSFGKGKVQQIFDLKDGTSLKLTVSKYFTPDGRDIDGEGITPDVEIKYEADEKNPDADNQLEEAIRILKNR